MFFAIGTNDSMSFFASFFGVDIAFRVESNHSAFCDLDLDGDGVAVSVHAERIHVLMSIVMPSYLCRWSSYFGPLEPNSFYHIHAIGNFAKNNWTSEVMSRWKISQHFEGITMTYHAFHLAKEFLRDR